MTSVGVGFYAPGLTPRHQVLVYDQVTRAIISPLLSVAELRALGVTLHVSIDAVRDAIPDVTAVYFVLPTPLNVRLVVEDAASGRYRDLALHFASPVPRPLLETMARGCVENGCAARVRRVVDQFLAFSALEHRLFSLNMSRSYAGYAAPGLTDAAIETYCGGVAAAVLCVFATLGVVPVIVASRGGPAELIARRLDAGLRELLAVPGGSVFSGGGALGGSLAPSSHESLVLPNGRRPAPLGSGAGARPVLVLADRDLDLATPLAHAATYQVRSLVACCSWLRARRRLHLVSPARASSMTRMALPRSTASPSVAARRLEQGMRRARRVLRVVAAGSRRSSGPRERL